MTDDDWDADDEDWYDEDDELDEEEAARCPECGAAMHVAAEMCPVCGYWLSAADRQAMSGTAHPLWLKVVAVVVLVAFVIGFVLAAAL